MHRMSRNSHCLQSILSGIREYFCEFHNRCGPIKNSNPGCCIYEHRRAPESQSHIQNHNPRRVPQESVQLYVSHELYVLRERTQSPFGPSRLLTQHGRLREDSVQLLKDLADGIVVEVEGVFLLLPRLWGSHRLLDLLHVLLDLSEALKRSVGGNVQLGGNSGVVRLE